MSKKYFYLDLLTGVCYNMICEEVRLLMIKQVYIKINEHSFWLYRDDTPLYNNIHVYVRVKDFIMSLHPQIKKPTYYIKLFNRASYLDETDWCYSFTKTCPCERFVTLDGAIKILKHLTIKGDKPNDLIVFYGVLNTRFKGG